MGVRRERRRGFQPPWYYVLIFDCGCGQVTLRQSWRGSVPPGAVVCPKGRHLLGFDGSIKTLDVEDTTSLRVAPDVKES